MANSIVLFNSLPNNEKIKVITLNRPDVLNAMSMELVEELHTILDTLMKDATTRVVILRGNGKAFCAGADLKANMYGKGGKQWDSTLLANQEFFSSLIIKMRRIPQPIIAVCHSSCAGGGLSLALGADIRLGMKGVNFIPSFATLGLTACELGTSFFLPRIIGSGNASLALLTGEGVRDEDALKMGLVSLKLFDNYNEMLDSAVLIANKMLKLSTLGLVLTKKQLNDSFSMSLEGCIHQEDIRQLVCLKDHGVREEMRDYIGRKFTNKL